MTAFRYRDGLLHAEGVALDAIAADVGTPFYCYSTAALTDRYRAFAAALQAFDPLICYAAKANPNRAVLATLARLGAGADVVSAGELRQALAAGIPADRIVFAGVGKQRDEMVEALAHGIHQFNVESEAELELLSAVATGLGLRAPVTLRVNPDVDAGTHAKISTGHGETKFGMPLAAMVDIARRAARLPGIRLHGLHVHIGSQIGTLGPFAGAFDRIAGLVAALRAEGIAMDRVDLGGGIGISDGDPAVAFDGYAALAARIFGPLGLRLVFEPGRLLVGDAGVLVTRLIRVKSGGARQFYIVDAAMNDLMRPALYGAVHPLLPVVETAVAARPVDVVGPVCETGDIFAADYPLPPLQEGALIAMLAAGAYGAAMSSSYNSRPLVPEVLVDGRRFAVVRRRPDFAEMTMLEALPPWLAQSGAGSNESARAWRQQVV